MAGKNPRRSVPRYLDLDRLAGELLQQSGVGTWSFHVVTAQLSDDVAALHATSKGWRLPDDRSNYDAYFAATPFTLKVVISPEGSERRALGALCPEARALLESFFREGCSVRRGTDVTAPGQMPHADRVALTAGESPVGDHHGGSEFSGHPLNWTGPFIRAFKERLSDHPIAVLQHSDFVLAAVRADDSFRLSLARK